MRRFFTTMFGGEGGGYTFQVAPLCLCRVRKLFSLIMWENWSFETCCLNNSPRFLEKPCRICTWPGNFWDTVLDGCRNILLLWHIDPPRKGEDFFWCCLSAFFSFVISTWYMGYIYIYFFQQGWYTTADGRDNPLPGCNRYAIAAFMKFKAGIPVPKHVVSCCHFILHGDDCNLLGGASQAISTLQLKAKWTLPWEIIGLNPRRHISTNSGVRCVSMFL